MADNLVALRDRRLALQESNEAVIKTAKTESRDLTDEEAAGVDKRIEDFDTLTAEIDTALKNRSRFERVTTARTNLEVVEPPLIPPVQPTTEPRMDLHSRQPAIPKPCRKLRCFTDPGGDMEAYRMGRWVTGLLLKNAPSLKWCGDNGVDVSGRMLAAPESRVLSTGDNTLGGFMVPEEFSPRIIRLVETYGVFRANTFIDPMARDTKLIGRGVGRLTSYFIGENTEPTSSDPKFGQTTLTAKLLAALIKMSAEINEDSLIDMGDYIATEVAYAFALKEDQCGFIGDGTSTYGGMTGVTPKIDDGTHTASIYDCVTGNTAFSTIDLQDFENALGKLPQFGAIDARWYISRVGYYASMARLMDAAGGNTKDDIAGGTGLQFLGIPVVISQVMNTTTAAQTSTVVCFVGNLRLASTFGDRRELGLMVSEHRYMELGQIGIRATERFDIVVHDLGDNTDAGPIVGVKTASS